MLNRSKLNKPAVFNIRVTPKASRAKIVPVNGGGFKAYLTRPAHDGLANEQLVGLLAGYLEVKKYQVKIIKGLKARDKIVEITPAG
jgi:uncharacterized protein (TIGR00251 family)